MAFAEDWNLAHRAKKGDMAAFEALVNRYRRPVIQFCYRMIGNLPDAEDVGQETFLNLYRSLDRLRQESAFSTVVFCYARNATLNHLRARRRHERRVEAFRRAPTVPDAPTPLDNARRQEASARIEAGIAALPPEYREVFVLREFQGLDYQRIAEILACPVGTVRSRLARAREQLREHLVRRHGDL